MKTTQIPFKELLEIGYKLFITTDFTLVEKDIVMLGKDQYKIIFTYKEEGLKNNNILAIAKLC